MFIRSNSDRGEVEVRYGDLWGTRKEKYETLSSQNYRTHTHIRLFPKTPSNLFVPQTTAHSAEYENAISIREIALTGEPVPGVVTTQDDFAISFEKDSTIEKVETLIATRNEDDARRLFQLCTQSQWNYEKAKAELSVGKWRSKICRILFKPFDLRWTVYDRNVAVHRRERASAHLVARPNLALITTRQTRDHWSVFVAKTIVAHKAMTAYDIGSVVPLYLYESNNKMTRRPNLCAAFIEEFSRKLGLKFVEDGRGDLKKSFGPEDVFDYIYAVFHSPTYRTRYAEFLKIDFPRVPLTSNVALFRTLVKLGGSLVKLHLLEFETRGSSEARGLSPLADRPVTYPVRGDHTVEKVRYVDKDWQVWINGKQYFEGVPKDVWEFHIGGYQVAEKWLKDRKGRTLSSEDREHYRKIIAALRETIRLMNEIDAAIPAWPIE